MCEKEIVYCLSNKYFADDVYKVGYTKDLYERMHAFNTCAIPIPFQCEFYIYVDDGFTTEQTIHKLLKQYRINKKREFFKVSIDVIRETFNHIGGEILIDMPKRYIKKKRTILELPSEIKTAITNVIVNTQQDTFCVNLEDVALWLDVSKKQLLRTLRESYINAVDYVCLKHQLKDKRYNNYKLLKITHSCMMKLMFTSRSKNANSIREYLTQTINCLKET